MEDHMLRYDLLQASDVDQMVHLLAAAFSAAEPPAVAMGLSYDELASFVSLLSPRALDAQYRHGRTIVRGEHLHLFMLAVDARFAGQGIAQRLVQTCLDNGREKGYCRAVTEATGLVSQRVFRKLGFEERYRVSYRDYRYGGEAVFASIEIGR